MKELDTTETFCEWQFPTINFLILSVYDLGQKDKFCFCGASCFVFVSVFFYFLIMEEFLIYINFLAR